MISPHKGHGCKYRDHRPHITEIVASALAEGGSDFESDVHGLGYYANLIRTGPFDGEGSDLFIGPIVVRNPFAIHTRPAAVIARIAKGLDADFFADNLTDLSIPRANLKSVGSILVLQATAGAQVRLYAHFFPGPESNEEYKGEIRRGLAELAQAFGKIYD
jgi:phosphotransferase system HPr-like phosphotransfer protein